MLHTKHSAEGYRKVKLRLRRIVLQARKARQEIGTLDLKASSFEGRDGRQYGETLGHIKFVEDGSLSLLAKLKELGAVTNEESAELVEWEEEVKREYKENETLREHLKVARENPAQTSGKARGMGKIIRREMKGFNQDISVLNTEIEQEKDTEKKLEGTMIRHFLILRRMEWLSNMLMATCVQIHQQIGSLLQTSGVKENNEAFRHLSRMRGRAFKKFVKDEVPKLDRIEQINLDLIQRFKRLGLYILYLTRLHRKQQARSEGDMKNHIAALMYQRGIEEQYLRGKGADRDTFKKLEKNARKWNAETEIVRMKLEELRKDRKKATK